MSDLLRIEYIPLSKILRWYKNPKKHDLGAIAESIERYGFVDPPKFDPSLNGGAGGLLYGNGRDEALEWMRAQGRALPRGIGYNETLDEWCMPIVFGVDAASEAAAESLAVAHNNLTMSGGDFTPGDMARMWDHTYVQLVQDLAALGELPAGMDGDDLDSLINGANEEPAEPSDGSLLELTNVTLAAPRHEVQTGDVWTVGGHTLICIDVMRGWALWSTHLEGDTTLFVPYPGPFAPLTIRADKYRMVMVQPDPYVAGHILDRYADVHGEASIGKE